MPACRHEGAHHIHRVCLMVPLVPLVLLRLLLFRASSLILFSHEVLRIQEVLRGLGLFTERLSLGRNDGDRSGHVLRGTQLGQVLPTHARLRSSVRSSPLEIEDLSLTLVPSSEARGSLSWLHRSLLLHVILP